VVLGTVLAGRFSGSWNGTSWEVASDKDLIVQVPVSTGDDTASFTVITDSDGTIDTIDQDGLTTFAIEVNAVSVSAPFDLDVADSVVITFDAAASDAVIILSGTYT
jgi:hypothetical protein